MNKTPIEWTHWSSNPLKLRLPDGTLINACVHKSRGCEKCYAEAIVRRWWKKELWGEFPGYTPALLKLGTPVLVEEELQAALRLSDRIARGKADPEQNKLFWNDMTDEYLEFWPDEFLDKLWAVRALTPNLIHQVLTKRPERMAEYCKMFADNATHLNAASAWASEMAHWLCDAGLQEGDGSDEDDTDWLYEQLWKTVRGGYFPNVHLGVSVEDRKTAVERIPLLLQTPAAVRWVSYEPALESVDFLYPATIWPKGPPMCCSGRECGCRGLPIEPPLIWAPNGAHIDWMVVGGESGPGARVFDLAWARSVLSQRREGRFKVFVKQVGAKPILDCPKGEEDSGQFREDGSARYWTIGFIKDSKGGDIDEWPEDLRVREFPEVAR